MKKMYSNKGDRLYRIVKIKVFAPGNTQCEKRVVAAPNGQGYNEKGVQQLLQDTADRIERAMPGHEYKLVELGPATFNFVWVAYAEPTLDEPVAAVTQEEHPECIGETQQPQEVAS